MMYLEFGAVMNPAAPVTVLAVVFAFASSVAAQGFRGFATGGGSSSGSGQSGTTGSPSRSGTSGSGTITTTPRPASPGTRRHAGAGRAHSERATGRCATGCRTADRPPGRSWRRAIHRSATQQRCRHHGNLTGTGRSRRRRKGRLPALRPGGRRVLLPPLVSARRFYHHSAKSGAPSTWGDYR